MSKVLILGDTILAHPLAELSRAAGHQTQVILTGELDKLPAGVLQSACAEAEIVLECLNSSKSAKQHLIKQLASGPRLYVSALACSATEAASWAADPGETVGWGAVPPLAEGGMVEVAAALQTRSGRLIQALNFWSGLGLSAVQVGDAPGLVRARILSMLINEAATAALEGVAAVEDIDVAMTLGTNYPRGLLAWCGLIGLDLVLSVLTGLQQEYGEERYRPCPLLLRYTQAGHTFYSQPAAS